MAFNPKLIPLFRILTFALLLCSQSSFTSCNKDAAQITKTGFDSIPILHVLNPLIREASGITDSRKNKGYLWVQEDSGNPTQLYLLGHDGKVSKTIFIKGIVNRDWEELQLYGTDLYLADIGDNGKKYTEYQFYIFEEPDASINEISTFQTVRFKYEDGPRDAEAFLVDAATKDIYIITKSDNPAKIYKITFPYSTNLNTATAVGALNYTGVVGAALSPDGKEAIVKTYVGLQHYSRKEGESILQMLQKSFTNIPYQLEPQGEAVTFSIDNSGYFTLSEKGMFTSVNLYFYKRK